MARIIYVEDDAQVGAEVQQALREAGHLVGLIDHGMLAFDTIAFNRPDLVILDQSLPDGQGLDIVRALRRLPALCRTPILMLSAGGGEAEMDEAMAAGANACLVKPFAPELLVRRVAEMLDDASLQDEAGA
ncbi:response regulator [Sphingomonas sp. CBMAI 2297]|uniref:response regulator transcription factor n=1 Tax=Sphingomonas sp. CBMAI 2297 TaxID=2991720 RepID=UPI00245793C8|nr:response regulator [Sphingomonas sp. CBMAI 2297]MDH4744175.1 response regulator [Sphingomonas sp. CBMAI 2297]